MRVVLCVMILALLAGCGANSTANSGGTANQAVNGAGDAGGDKEVSDARKKAEDVLGSLMSWARVAYAKTGVEPKTLTGDMDGGGCKVSPDGLKDDHYQVRDVVYKKPDMERGALVCEPLKDEKLGFGAVYFNYAGGKGDYEWYDTKEKLEDALKAFRTAK
ncbi:MAG: hypothetical protein IT464_15800 [Planctomycetes bacterium]|nr:hypothetical protein [Planctomycetota bacterium]